MNQPRRVPCIFRHAVNTSLYTRRRHPASDGLQTQGILLFLFANNMRLASCALTLMFVLTISACSTLGHKKSSAVDVLNKVDVLDKNDAIGKLAALSSTPVFVDSALSQEQTNRASHGLILNHSSPYRILLSNGQIAWSKQQPPTLSVKVKISSGDANFSNLPQADQDKAGFTWLDYKQDQTFSIVAASNTLYQETPAYIEQQGRKLNAKAFYALPQLQIANKNHKGWISAQYLEFISDTEEQVTLSGLVQKSFLLLTKKDIVKPITRTKTYLEVAHNTTEKLSIPKATWVAEQAINLADNANTEIESVTLASSKNNCNLLFIRWRTKDEDAFGYCNDRESAPTPFILSYAINQQFEGLTINTLEISGDSERKAKFVVSHKFKPGQSIRVISE